MTRPDYWRDCTPDCERAVRCVVCGKTKAPLGRDPGLYRANAMCDSDCPGYRAEPKPGHLWPGELAQMDEPETP